MVAPPSQARVAWLARRLSGGVVMTTYAAASAADARTAFATVRAVASVIGNQLRREPLEPVVDCVVSGIVVLAVSRM